MKDLKAKYVTLPMLRFIRLLSGRKRKQRLEKIRILRKRRAAILELDKMQIDLEALRDQSTGAERVRCINDLYMIRLTRAMTGC